MLCIFLTVGVYAPYATCSLCYATLSEYMRRCVIGLLPYTMAYTYCELCLWQVYAIFIIIWQFVIPLIIFIAAYWKILAVVRRQVKVASDRHHRSTKSNEPVAGPSKGTAETENAVLSKKDESQRDEVVMKGAVKAGQRERGRVGNQQGLKSLSKAQINVVRTMIYITVCFTVCWMPMYAAVMVSKITVKQFKSLSTVGWLPHI